MAIALLLRYEPAGRRLATNAWWRYQCAQYTASVDKVAYLGPYSAYSTAPNPPACFDKLDRTGFPPPVLFLHRLKNSRGSCVVAVTLNGCDGDEHGETLQMHCVKINPDGSFSNIDTDWDEADSKQFYGPTLTDVTFFAGQVDGSDPSAFTITYSARDECGCILGWLDDDGKIHFHPSHDPAHWNGYIYVPHMPLPTNDSGGI